MKVNFFAKTARILSTVSTTLVIVGFASTMGDSWIITIISGLFGVFFGAFVAFKVMPDMIKEQFFTGVIVVSGVMAWTYPQNAKPLHDFVVETKAKELLPTFSKDMAIWKNGLEENKENDNSISLNAKKAEIELEIKKAKSNINISSFIKATNNEYMKAKKNHKHGDWWTSNSALSGCKDKGKTNQELRTHRISCVADYRAMQSLSPTLGLALLAINEKININNQKVQQTKNTNKEITKKFNDAKNRIIQSRKDANNIVPGESYFSGLLWMVGLLLEGVITAFDLIMIFRNRLQAKKLANKTKNIKKKIEEKETLLFTFILNFLEYEPLGEEEKINIFEDLNNIVNWDKKRVSKKRRKAIVNNFLGAILIYLDKGINGLTEDEILKINDKNGGIYIFTNSLQSIEPLGSTSRQLTINGAKINPRAYVIEFITTKAKGLAKYSQRDFVILTKLFVDSLFETSN